VRLNSINRRLVITTSAIALFAFLAIVTFSPLALRALADSAHLNWARLSNVGQTYGAISALITALAFGGVVISLWYQAREVSATRAQAIRSFHFDLLRMELEDEGHMWASGAPWGYAIPADYRRLREHIFVHMWLSFWQSQFVLKEMSAEFVRGSAKELFYGKAGREYWMAVGHNRLEVSEGRDLEYLQIVDDEYWKALKNGPPVTPEGGSTQRISTPGIIKRDRRRTAASCAVAAAAGALAGHLICQALTHRRHRSGGPFQEQKGPPLYRMPGWHVTPSRNARIPHCARRR